MEEFDGSRFQAALADRFVFDRELGCGGMGVVYLARDVKHGRQVAIKALVGDERSTGRIDREIRVTAQLQHPNVLTLLDSGVAAGYSYYVMPYVRGGSLRDMLNSRKRLSVGEAVRLAVEVGDALQHAHENGVIHCDIKPENILMSVGHAVVADFGISRSRPRNEKPGWLGDVQTSGGTPEYVSPEQASGDANVDERSDVFSLGCVLFEMLSGEPPFKGLTEQAVIADRFTGKAPRVDRVVRHVPEGIALIVSKAMAVDPEDRFRCAVSFVKALTSELATGNAVTVKLQRRSASVIGRGARRWLGGLMRKAPKAIPIDSGSFDAVRVVSRANFHVNTVG